MVYFSGQCDYEISEELLDEGGSNGGDWLRGY